MIKLGPVCMLTEASLNVFNVVFPFQLQSGTHTLMLRPQDHVLKLTITNLQWSLVPPVHPTIFPWQSYSPARLHNYLPISQALVIFSFLTLKWWCIRLILPQKQNQQKRTSACPDPNAPTTLCLCLPHYGGCTAPQVASPCPHGCRLHAHSATIPSHHPEDIRLTLPLSHCILPCL